MFSNGQNSLRKLYPGCLSIVKDLQQARTFAEKEHPKGLGKGDGPEKTPVDPHTLGEDKYYSQKTQKELEEIKEKLEKAALENPENKKE